MSGNFVGTSASGNSALGNRPGRRGHRERQRQSTDRLHVSAGSRSSSTTCSAATAATACGSPTPTTRRSRPISWASGPTTPRRGQWRRRPAGLGFVQEHAGRRRDPAGQRDLRQQPQRHRSARQGQRIHLVQHLRRESSPSGPRRQIGRWDPDHLERRQQPDPHLHRLGQSSATASSSAAMPPACK